MAETPMQQLSDAELRRGYWVVTHREGLQKFAIGVAVAIDVVLVLIAVILLTFVIIRIPQTRAITQQLATPLEIPNRRVPQALQIVQATAVRHDATSIDVIVDMKNPNAIWAAQEIEYDLVVGGNTIDTSVQNLAPGQEKVFAAVNIQRAQGDIPTVRVTVTKVVWRKIQQADVPQTTWQFSKPELKAIDVTTGTSNQSGQNASIQTELTVDVRNGSVLGFREPEVVVLLKDSGGSIIGVGKIVLDTIRSLESRSLTFRFPFAPQSGITPTVFVNVDVLNTTRIIRTLAE